MNNTVLWYRNGKFNHLGTRCRNLDINPMPINNKQAAAWANSFWIFCPCSLVNNKVVLIGN